MTNNTAGDQNLSWSPFLSSPPASPVVTSISPLAGPVAGGTGVTITGSNFQSGGTVSFDSSPATGIVVVSPDTISATTPTHPAGTVSIIVTYPDGQEDTLFNRFGYGDLSTNTKIAFDPDRDANREIYVMNADGTNPVNLTNNPAEDNRSSWSPDGMKIAFCSFRDSNFEIYVMNADGTNPVNLTNNTAFDCDPSWSPDGTKMAFRSDRDGNFEIYVMNADGTKQTRLTNNTARDEGPFWSPDGTKIAFYSTRDGLAEIYAMNADGTNPVNLTNNTATDASASWSPFLATSVGFNISGLVSYFSDPNKRAPNVNMHLTEVGGVLKAL